MKLCIADQATAKKDQSVFIWTERWTDKIYLCTITQRRLYLLLAELHKSEEHKGGRLKKFRHLKIYNSNIEIEIYHQLNSLTPYIDWIGENIHMRWSFRIIKIENSDYGFYIFAAFSFQSEAEAMHFALRWK